MKRWLFLVPVLLIASCGHSISGSGNPILPAKPRTLLEIQQYGGTQAVAWKYVIDTNGQWEGTGRTTFNCPMSAMCADLLKQAHGKLSRSTLKELILAIKTSSLSDVTASPPKVCNSYVDGADYIYHVRWPKDWSIDTCKDGLKLNSKFALAVSKADAEMNTTAKN